MSFAAGVADADGRGARGDAVSFLASPTAATVGDGDGRPRVELLASLPVNGKADDVELPAWSVVPSAPVVVVVGVIVPLPLEFANPRASLVSDGVVDGEGRGLPLVPGSLAAGEPPDVGRDSGVGVVVA